MDDVVRLGFYVPPTAKVIRRRDPGLKSHPKKTGEAWDQTCDPWFTRCVA